MDRGWEMRRVISPAEHDLVRHVVARLGGPVGAVAPIEGRGSVNKIFRVTTPRGRVVVRLNADRGVAEFEKEAWCIERARSQGVPGPSVLALGIRDGYSYMVQTFIAGTDGAEAMVNRSVVWRTIGRYAKSIHALQKHGYGLTLNEIRDYDFQERWMRHLTYNIDSLTPDDALIHLEALASAHVPGVPELFEHLRRTPFDFGLNHGDLSLKNVIVGEQAEISLIDWGCAEAHVVPHNEIGVILLESLHRDSAEFAAFLLGYGLSEHDFRQIEADVRALMLLRAVDTLRWAIDQHPVVIPTMVETVKRVYKSTFA